MLIKTYPKNFLAQRYMPELKPRSASRAMNRWISGDKTLMEELRKVGYFEHIKNHYYTKQEVALLFEYIGEP